MDGVDRGRGLWRNVKERLRLKRIGFCGSTWSLADSNSNIIINLTEENNSNVLQDQEEEEEEEEPVGGGGVSQIPAETTAATLPCVGHIPAMRAATGMNLAAALAAERNPRSVGPTSSARNQGAPGFTPLRSLMGLFEETDGEDRKRRKTGKEGKGSGGIDAVCCVCMERNKGAAFIPCGHTYCRVCSRELWSNRGSCPLCNCSITEILDIF